MSMTHSAYLLKHMHRGAQKELVRDFDLIATLENGEQRKLCSVRNNSQRLVRLSFNEVSVTALRAEILATNGSPKITVSEIRAYA